MTSTPSSAEPADPGHPPPQASEPPASAAASHWLRTLLALVAAALALAGWGFVTVADGLAEAGVGDTEALNLAAHQVFLAERLASMAVGTGSETTATSSSPARTASDSSSPGPGSIVVLRLGVAATTRRTVRGMLARRAVGT